MSLKKVFYFPFTNQNQYVDISKESIGKCGFDVVNFKRLFQLKNIVNRKYNVVVLNWYEDRLYQNRFGFIRFLLEHIIVLVQLCVMRLFTAKIIWVRHNYKPHNRPSRPLSHKLVCAALSALANKTVTLEDISLIRSNVVPHPLYRTDRSIEDEINSSAKEQYETEYLFFGTIKPYKRLHDLLEFWPSDKPLKIVGHCKDFAYIQKIENLILDKNINVDWQNAYISDDDLNQLLCKTKFVIMPHSDESMISSGTFYQAINFGVNIICFESHFAKSKSVKHDFVHIVSKTNFANSLNAIAPVPKQKVLEEALRFYGREVQFNEWNKILNRSK